MQQVLSRLILIFISICIHLLILAHHRHLVILHLPIRGLLPNDFTLLTPPARMEVKREDLLLILAPADAEARARAHTVAAPLRRGVVGPLKILAVDDLPVLLVGGIDATGARELNICVDVR